MSTHTLQTEIEVELADGDNAYPTIEIEYDYERGYTPKTPRGEYAPIDPPVGPELSFRAAKVIAADGVMDFPFQYIAKKWLLGPGHAYACDCAELDLLGQRSLHLEDWQ